MVGLSIQYRKVRLKMNDKYIRSVEFYKFTKKFYNIKIYKIVKKKKKTLKSGSRLVDGWKIMSLLWCVIVK